MFFDGHGGGPALLRAGDLRPARVHTIFVGAQHVWRTQDSGRRPLVPRGSTATPLPTSSARATCSTRVPAARGDHWTPMSTSLTAAALRYQERWHPDAPSRADATPARCGSPRRAAASSSRRTRTRRPASITFTRIDTAAQPDRVPSSVFVDPTNANHAIVTFSGYEANTPTTLGHVFDVVYDPGVDIRRRGRTSRPTSATSRRTTRCSTRRLATSTSRPTSASTARVAGETGVDPGRRRNADGGRLRPDDRQREERRSPGSTRRRTAVAHTGSA